jgi:hypothetical protein
VKKQKWHKLLIHLFSLPNLPPLLAIKKILWLFEDVVFYSSIKMSTGLVLFLFWWASIFLCGEAAMGMENSPDYHNELCRSIVY